jgi:FAD/FMN-containing dehydrogenase
MMTRREFLLRCLAFGSASALPALVGGCAGEVPAEGLWVNDIHSKLNRTRVAEIIRPTSTEALAASVREARRAGSAFSIAGGRHAMGGQQFGTGTTLIDTTAMTRVMEFDRDRGLVEVEAGIQWPDLHAYLREAQTGGGSAWGFNQKQTGADRLSLGGALSANVHGRGLRLKPIVQDIESFVLIDAQGQALRCSRDENAELFRLAIGGYGNFGIIASVRLRLVPRIKLRRVVEIGRIDGLMEAFESRMADGFMYGDFQFSTDNASEGFLRQGVFSCYLPVDADTPMPEGRAELGEADWRRLLYLSHAEKRKAFETYAGYYLSTSGQVYWSDTHQLSLYVDHYHEALDTQLGASEPGSEMITEIYVPRPALGRFMEQVRADFLEREVEFIYGTIRLIERDDETVLAWARQSYACVIFNLHVRHTQAGIEKAADDFRRLIDRAIDLDGSYFPTYHRWATRDQVMRCHPRMIEFLRAKRRYDPEVRFQSDWYRHYRDMFTDAI